MSQFGKLPDACRDYHAVDFGSHAKFLRDPDEFIRRQNISRIITHPDQRFIVAGDAGAKIHNWLVVHAEATSLKCLLEGFKIVKQGAEICTGRFIFLVVKIYLIAAFFLGQREREVSVIDQRLHPGVCISDRYAYGDSQAMFTAPQHDFGLLDITRYELCLGVHKVWINTDTALSR